MGRHASGRNSGVLHSGIYYKPNSLKAKVCTEGARLLYAYALEHNVPVCKTGKVIVATEPAALPMIDLLYEQGLANGARVEKIDSRHLQQIEPEAATREKALFSPDTAVVDAHKILECLEKEIEALGVRVIKSAGVCAVKPQERIVKTEKGHWGYGRLVNAAGLYADRIAHWMGVGQQYRILPFKGVYRKLSQDAANRFRGSIYPVPNLRMPFLGVHLTKTIYGEVLAGPTAMPALGRENYGIFDGLDFKDLPGILSDLFVMVRHNEDGFRNLVKEEMIKYHPSGFFKCIRSLAPSLHRRDLLPQAAEVGIRAQLVNVQEMRLVTDFMIEEGDHSTHILNAISPAFTASLSFAELVANELERCRN